MTKVLAITVQLALAALCLAPLAAIDPTWVIAAGSALNTAVALLIWKS